MGRSLGSISAFGVSLSTVSSMTSWKSVGLLKPAWVVQNVTGQFYQLGFYITSLNIIILAIVTAAAFFSDVHGVESAPLAV
jgi:hypothetical protein